MSETAALDVASLSHPGMVRSHNEDSVFVDGEAGIAVLADGMGGYNAGEVASGIAVNVVSNGMMPELKSGRELSKIDVQSGLTHGALLLQQQIASANKGIYEAAQARPECAGMGTTIVAAVFCGNRVSIGHIGDSRCYRLRGEKFEQLTRDHSLLQEQIDSGVLTPEQARYSLNKNLVTRALGIEAIVPTDIAEYRIEANDIYLLCSDGLTDMVEPEVIHSVVDEKRSDLAVAAAELVDLANQNGGRDNISVILVRVPPGIPAAVELGAALARQEEGLNAMGKLVLFLADGTTMDVPLDSERITIGRRADNDVCLPYPAVSGEHAAVVTILADSFLEDLGSTNGTLVNGKADRQALPQPTTTRSTSAASASRTCPTTTREARSAAARHGARRSCRDFSRRSRRRWRCRRWWCPSRATGGRHSARGDRRSRTRSPPPAPRARPCRPPCRARVRRWRPWPAQRTGPTPAPGRRGCLRPRRCA